MFNVAASEEIDQTWVVDKTIEVRHSVIVQAKNKNKDKTVVLKFYTSGKEESAARKRIWAAEFRDELMWMNTFNHERIIKAHGCGNHHGVNYIAMEFLEHGDLIHFLVKVIPASLRPQVVPKIFSQLISGLQYMHSLGIAHCDIKPDNLMVNGNLNLKIGDFGHSRRFIPGERKFYRKYGTKQYCAPEVYHLIPHCPDKADVWAAGVTLLYITRYYKWGAPDVYDDRYRNFYIDELADELWKDIDVDLRQLVEGMLKRMPWERMTLDQVVASKWLSKPVES